MNELIEKQFGAYPVRIVEEDGSFWFNAADVCSAIGLADASKGVQGLDEEEKGKKLFPTLGGEQACWALSESGLYVLLLRSDKPDAKPFRNWVTREVIPSIRKTGTYSVQPLTPCEQLLVQAQMLVEQERRTNEAIRLVQKQNVKIEEIGCNNRLALDKADMAIARAESNHGHFSVMGYAVLCKKQITVKEAAKHGRELTKMCKGLGVEIGNLPDPRFGRISTYPESILKEYFQDWKRA